MPHLEERAAEIFSIETMVFPAQNFTLPNLSQISLKLYEFYFETSENAKEMTHLKTHIDLFKKGIERQRNYFENLDLLLTSVLDNL